MIPPWASFDQGDILVKVKAVPGSSRNRVQGVLGDHIKIQVSAPPEGGKANAAIVLLLAELFRLNRTSIRIESGTANARKVFRVCGVTESALQEDRFSVLRPDG